MKKRLFDYLSNRKLLKLSYVYESFFLYKKLDRPTKLKKEILKLNYLKESPYDKDNTTLVSIVEEDNLYLWFYKKSKIRLIPEALLLFRYLSKKYDNGLFIFEEDSINHIIVIKDKRMIASFGKRNIRDLDIKLMRENFSFLEKDTIKFSKNEYRTILKNGLNSLKISDILQLLDISLDFRRFLDKAIQLFSLPLLIGAILLVLILSGYNYYIKDRYNKLYSIYQSKQKNTLAIKEKVEKSNKLIETFNKIFHDEFKYKDKIVAIFEITKEVNEQNMTLFYIRSNSSDIEFEVRGDKEDRVPKLIEKLFLLGYFNDVKSDSIQHIRGDTIKVKMSATLKRVE